MKGQRMRSFGNRPRQRGVVLFIALILLVILSLLGVTAARLQTSEERMARNEKVSLRTSPKAYMTTVVEQFNLSKWVGQEAAREKLMQAGYRGQGPYVAFLFFRMIVPLVTLVGSLIYVFLILNLDQPASIKGGACLAASSRARSIA